MSESRDTLVDRYNRATYAGRVLSEIYQICLSNLVTLHNSYLRSKEEKNVLQRYNLLRSMIKVSEQISHHGLHRNAACYPLLYTSTYQRMVRACNPIIVYSFRGLT